MIKAQRMLLSPEIVWRFFLLMDGIADLPFAAIG
jgi:hypothetical protein